MSDRYKNERDSVVVGIRGNVYNWLSYGIVGNSVCRTWESCTLAFPCPVNRVIHDSIASYAHFHNACLLFFGFLIRNSVVLAVYLLFLVSASLLHMSIISRISAASVYLPPDPAWENPMHCVVLLPD